jgi:hypothetical protein
MSLSGAAEWAIELAETLAHRGHGLAQITVASYRGPAGRDEVIAIARRAGATAGWPVYELSATHITEEPSQLQETGFLILRDIDVPLPMSVPILVGAFQHLVRRDLPVGLLVVGTTRGISALRKNPSVGFLSRADSVIET